MIIPKPLSVTPGAGEFIFDDTVCLAPGPDATCIQDLLEQRLGFRPGISPEGTIRLEQTPLAGGSEAYQLTVSESEIRLAAGTGAGMFYGIQTLLQLLPGQAPAAIPAQTIQDAPRFGWRGLMLDVGRHLFSPAEIKTFIDLMASYKLNRFHWHLTEDQGWRIEIKKYPGLTEIGNIRKETVVGHANDKPNTYDGTPYGGFYTQDEVREIVAYAAARHITVVPEIDIPGHCMAAIAAYPEFGSTKEPLEVATIWGVHKEGVLNVAEGTFRFVFDVLDEVMALFPSEFIHIGADEAPKDMWEQDEHAQRVIKREGLKDEHELQSYFIGRVEKHLNANGRRLIGWDEILEGGLAPTATVMSWRGEAGGIAAARQGNDAVMTPNQHLYFDYYQTADKDKEPLAIGGLLPLEKVYGYDPIPAELTELEAVHILGVQANVWTEYMSTMSHVQYMTFPRAFALAEIAWSPVAMRDWPDFQERVAAHGARLDALGVNHRR